MTHVAPSAVLLALLTGPVQLLSQDITTAQFERLKKVCKRPADAPAARKPHDLNETLGPIARGEAFAELGPRVLSSDPWVIVFDRFLSEEEMVDIDSTLFEKSEALFKGSVADRASSMSQARHSETAFCIGACDTSTASQLVQRRAGAIARTPVANIDFVQALRYRTGMFYKRHHDNRESFKYLPCGTRTFTFFVYLSDVEEGGGTDFPRLNLTVQPQRGRAVLFQDTLDSDPTTSDDRTDHEALPVVRGLKRGLNVWLYQYSYKSLWKHGCTGIAFADMLAGYIQPSDAPPPGPKLVVRNQMSETVEVFWVHPNTGEEVRVLEVKAGESTSLDTHPEHRFVARLPAAGRQGSDPGASPVGSYTATAAGSQTFDIIAANHGKDEL